VPAINPDWKGVIRRPGLSLFESHGRNNLLPSLDGGFIPRVLGPLSGSLHLEVKRNARGCRQLDDTSRHAVLCLNNGAVTPPGQPASKPVADSAGFRRPESLARLGFFFYPRRDTARARGHTNRMTAACPPPHPDRRDTAATNHVTPGPVASGNFAQITQVA
jgi:hypothetical protein